MTVENIAAIIALLNIWLFIKLFVLVLLFFYFVLSLIITRQVDLMNQVLGTRISPAIQTAVVFHAIAVGILFFLAVVLI